MPPIRHRPQRLLVATDLSPNSMDALGRALRLPVARDAEIALLHVTSRPHVHSLPTVLTALLTEAMTQRRSWRGRAIIEEIVCGTPSVEIVRHAHSFDADLIVVGRHRKRGVLDPFVGTTASRVVRTAGCPVLVVAVRPKHDYRTPLLATDLEAASHRLVRLAASVLDEDVELRAVHAVSADAVRMAAMPADHSAASLRMARFIDVERRRIRVSGRIRVGSVATTVLDEATTIGADLLVVGTYADSAMARALVSTSNHGVLANASCDVLVGAPFRRVRASVGHARPST